MIHRISLTLLISSLSGTALLAQAGPGPEIYLLPMTIRGAAISVGKPVNITNRPGYDNQPSWSPDSREILFTSVRQDSQADIYRYNVESKVTERITHSAPESEYSATLLPYPKRFSAIRVEKDSTQRLWSFSPDGNEGRPVFTDIKPVGYHTWIDTYHLALFVLGSPNSLVLADTRTGKGEVLARDIGRSLLTLPHGGGFSFLSHHGQDWVLTVVRLKRNSTVAYITPVVTLPRGMDYVAWIGGGLIGGSGSKLYSWKPGGDWTEVADLASSGLTRISRIAISPNHRTLAIVAEPAAASRP